MTYTDFTFKEKSLNISFHNFFFLIIVEVVVKSLVIQNC
jgi:hypothetical protein